jgi:hypothetical protein
VVCPGCGEHLERAVVLTQLAKGRDFGFCNGCGDRLVVASGEPIGAPPVVRQVTEQQDVARQRTAFETALVGVKAVVRDVRQVDTPPTCFVSYAWGVPDHERWVGQLAKDLRHAGVDVVFDRWHNPPGSSLTRFTDRILACDFVLVVGTPALRRKYEATDGDPVVAAEMTLVNTRLRQPSRYGPTVIPVLLDGERESAFTPMLHDIVAVDVRAERRRFTGLFDLVWRIHDLPPDHPRHDELRASLAPER